MKQFFKQWKRAVTKLYYIIFKQLKVPFIFLAIYICPFPVTNVCLLVFVCLFWLIYVYSFTLKYPASIYFWQGWLSAIRILCVLKRLNKRFLPIFILLSFSSFAIVFISIKSVVFETWFAKSTSGFCFSIVDFRLLIVLSASLKAPGRASRHRWRSS